MSIIFQLFHADDLDRLKKEELQEIFQLIQDKKHLLVSALDNSLNPGQQGGAQYKNEPEQLTPEVAKRREVVFQQLRLRESSSQQSRAIGDRRPDQLEGEDRKFLILAWAVDCEVGNRNFYEVLKGIRDDVYAKYRSLTQQEPMDPDSLYSPFNPRGPLYRLYNP